MKLVNRLIDIDEGDITIGGQSVRALECHRAPARDRLRDPAGRALPAHDRRRQRRDRPAAARPARRARSRARVDELLDLVDLPAADYRERFPSQLSGGERQRVGLARALAANPPVMLMDEPFGAVDPITRARLQHELLRIQSELRKTIIFVTHDIDEAIMLGDRIAILREGGVLAQYDTPEAHPRRTPRTTSSSASSAADRGIKLLALRRLDELELAPLDGTRLTASRRRPARRRFATRSR